MSDSVRPHRRQTTRLPCPWDSPGKNTGVGCHFLLQCMKVKSESEVAQSCPTPSDLMNRSLPGSSVHGIFQAKVLEWGAIAFSKPPKPNSWKAGPGSPMAGPPGTRPLTWHMAPHLAHGPAPSTRPPSRYTAPFLLHGPLPGTRPCSCCTSHLLSTGHLLLRL